MITFFVPGKPEPGGSKRGFVVKGRAILTDANKNVAGWKQDVKAFAAQTYKGDLLDGALEVQMIFFLERPKSHYRTGKNSHLLRDDAPKYPTSKPDATKLCRSTEDALTGVVWTDDARIVNQLNAKRFGKPGVKITIKHVD